MDTAKQRRLRFGLKLLLTLVALSAVVTRIGMSLDFTPLTIEERARLIGLTREEVVNQIGKPENYGMTKSEYESWDYSDELVVDFRNGRCVDAYYPF